MVYQHIQSAYKMQFTRGVPLLLMNDRHWSAPCDMCDIPPHFHKQTTWTHVRVPALRYRTIDSPAGGGGGEEATGFSTDGGCGIVSVEATGATSSAGGEGVVISTGGAEMGSEAVLVIGWVGMGGGGGVKSSIAGGEATESAREGEVMGSEDGGGAIISTGGDAVISSAVGAGGAMDSPAGTDTAPTDSAGAVTTGGGGGRMTGSASGGGGAVVVTCTGSLTRSGKEEGGREVTGSGGGDIGTSAGRGSTTGVEAGGVLVGGRRGPEGSLMRSMTFSESWRTEMEKTNNSLVSITIFSHFLL